MSEERPARIETMLAALAGVADATKADIAALRAESKADLAALRAELVAMRREIATKADIADVAKNVDITALGRQLARVSDDMTALKDDLAVTTAMAQRIDHVTSRLITDVPTEIRAEHSRMNRLLTRVGRLEADRASPADAE